jgi:hypothetical protein
LLLTDDGEATWRWGGEEVDGGDLKLTGAASQCRGEETEGGERCGARW